MRESPDVAGVIRAIASGSPLAWHTVSPQVVDESLHGVLAELRVIARIAQVHGNAARVALESDADAGQEEPSRWGPLTVLEKVGSGSYGTVYRAWDPRLEREVALKLLPADDQTHTASVEEARLLARVRHPNVATVYGADQIDGITGIWMEFVDGRDLEQILHTDGPLPADEVCEVGRQLCDALGAVHGAGLLHRDIKAQNVMRQDDGRLVLMDFGAGRGLQEETRADDVAGTPLYLAPEILNGQAASASSDLYSVGVLLYHLLTGDFPVSGQNIHTLRDAHREGRQKALRSARAEIPARLLRVVNRALARDPEQRYQSAAAMAEALPRSPSAPRHGLALAGAAVVFGLAVSSAAVMLSHRGSDQPKLSVQPPAADSTRIVAEAPGVAAQQSPGTASPERSSGSPVAALRLRARHWVLIAPFENKTGEAVLDGTLEYALERDLSNSSFVNVVPRDRIDNVLRLMVKPIDTKLDRRLVREVCLRDGDIRALVIGRVEKIGSSFVTTAQIVDPQDDTVVASLSEEAAGQTELLSAVSRQALRVREALGEMVSTIRRSQAALERVTTPSLHALYLYSRASDLMHGPRWQNEAAEQLSKQAVSEDDRFASAYILLAHTIRNQLRPKEEYLPYAERAFQLASQTSDVERYFIVGSYYGMQAGGLLPGPERDAALRQSLSAYEALMRIKPDHYWGAGNIYITYETLNREPHATEALARLSDIRGEQTVPLDLILRLLSRGLVERARTYMRRSRASVTTAVARQFPSVARDLQWMNAYEAWTEKDVVRAWQFVEPTIHGPTAGELTTMNIPREGSFFNGLGRLSEVRPLVSRTPPEFRNAMLAGLLVEETDLNKPGAKDALSAFLITYGSGVDALLPLRANGVHALIRLGRLDEARAMIPRLAGPALADPALPARLAIAEGRFDDGAGWLQSSRETLSTSVRLSTAEALARGYRQRARFQEGIALLEDALKGSWPEYVGATWGVAYWIQNKELLADLYRDIGRNEDAEAIDTELLRLLAAADEDYPVLVRLRQRRAQLAARHQR